MQDNESYYFASNPLFSVLLLNALSSKNIIVTHCGEYNDGVTP